VRERGEAEGGIIGVVTGFQKGKKKRRLEISRNVAPKKKKKKKMTKKDEEDEDFKDQEGHVDIVGGDGGS